MVSVAFYDAFVFCSFVGAVDGGLPSQPQMALITSRDHDGNPLQTRIIVSSLWAGGLD